MNPAQTPAVERIARALAGRRASVNGVGEETSASKAVDSTWRDYQEDALAVLRALREPDRAMAAAGSADVWERMIRAAIGEGGEAGKA